MLCPYCDAGVNPGAIKTGLVTGERSIRCDVCNEIIFIERQKKNEIPCKSSDRKCVKD